MRKRETEVERLARITAKAVQGLQGNVKDIRAQMVTKDDLEVLPTMSELKDVRDEVVTYLKDIKADVKQVIADEAANTVAIARLDERVTKLEKRAHIGR